MVEKVVIRTRNYKKGRYIVAYVDGKRVSARKWKKDFMLRDAKETFQQNNTLKDISKSRFYTGKEVTFYNTYQKPRQSKRAFGYQVQAWVTVGNKRINGWSHRRSMEYKDIDSLKREAEINLLKNVAQLHGKAYDEDEGIAILEKKNVYKNIQYRTIVWKTRRRNSE